VDLDPDACYRAVRTRDARFDGRLFCGCRTTGIYCRPICPAQTPRREHMVFFPTAAAAQAAGFRPCLRCRPETAPDVAAWRGTSNTVSRALSLIDAGALDEGGVSLLASRLGVGERHLRRLFATHVGAPPIAVAQTRRLLLAVRLIRDTQLSMADVALAAGFGSIRRFNEVFQRLYGRPPHTLRSRRDDEPLPMSSRGLVIRLPYRPPYDWSAVMAFLEARAIPGVETVSGDRYGRSIEFGGTTGVIFAEPSDGNALRVEISFPNLAVLPVVIDRLRRVFDLGADPDAIDGHLATDAALAPLVRARPGLRVPGGWDGFELAVRAILGQQITVKAAVRLAGKLVAAYGEPVCDPVAQSAGITHAFPTAPRLAAADLGPLGMPRARAAALVALARAIADTPHLLGVGASLEECVERLRALPGIGEWTAQYIAMRELREPDAFPAGDLVLQKTMARLEGRTFSTRDLLARAERWRPWRAYAAQHLWALAARSDAVLAAPRRERTARVHRSLVPANA
jgi:AraC family transcriptional regulator of adaptative response / DNA-3-methyladenine glycosylase II